MKIIPVENVDEVLKIALRQELKPVEWLDINQKNTDEESKNIRFDFEDEIISNSVLVFDGEVKNERFK